MKKLLALLLCVTMVLCAMAIPAFAEGEAEFRLANAYPAEGKVQMPVYITAIPEGLDNVMSIDLVVGFDEAVLEYTSTTPGTANGSLFAASLDKTYPNKIKVTWADATDISKKDAKVNPDTIGKDNPLFTINFNVIDNSSAYTDILAENVKLAGGRILPDEVFEIVKPSSKSFVAVSGRVIFKDAPADDGENGNQGGSADDSENGNQGGSADDSENGNQGGSADDSENGSQGGSADDKNNGNTSSGSGDTGAGPIKPNTSGTGRPSGGSGNSSGGGIAVIPQTPTTPATPGEDDTTDKPVVEQIPQKASEVFSDVDDSHWAAQYALKLYNAGIVSGDSEKRANLSNEITRQETSKLALLVNGIDVDSAAALDVADADSVSDWAKGFMATAVKNGIFSGYEDGTVRPLNKITRQEMVTVIIKSLKIDIDADASVSFADNADITWSAPYVAKAVELGFVNGYEDGTFLPGKAITRAEAFTIFARVLDYINK